MHSRSLSHYPHQVYRDGEKMLQNPINGQVLKNRPEERVRLKIIEYLMLEMAWPKSRISVETALKLHQSDHKLRADLICYDKDFKPEILIECKADQVTLDDKAAQQIARYNTVFNAPYLMISNGIVDHWFGLDQEVETLENPPFPTEPHEMFNFWRYWEERGFCGHNSPPNIRNWLVEQCSELYKSQIIPENIHYFNFETAPVDFYLQGYYKVIPFNQKYRFAFGFTSTPYGSTRLNIILNKEGNNKAIISVVLELLSAGEKSNALYYTERGYSNADVSDFLTPEFDYPIASKLNEILAFVLRQS